MFDDDEGVMKGRQKKLNSLTEMGGMTVVKRSEAVGARVIQTRWGSREAQVGSEGFQSKSGAYSARDVLTNTNTL